MSITLVHLESELENDYRITAQKHFITALELADNEKFFEAIGTLEESLKRYQSIRDKTLDDEQQIVRCYINIVSFYDADDYVEEAIDALHQLLTYIKVNLEPKKPAIINLNLITAKVYRKLSNYYDEILNSDFETTAAAFCAVKILEPHKDIKPSTLLKLYEIIIKGYLKMQRYIDAIAFFDKSFQIYSAIGLSSEKTSSCINNIFSSFEMTHVSYIKEPFSKLKIYQLLIKYPKVVSYFINNHNYLTVLNLSNVLIFYNPLLPFAHKTKFITAECVYIRAISYMKIEHFYLCLFDLMSVCQQASQLINQEGKENYSKYINLLHEAYHQISLTCYKLSSIYHLNKKPLSRIYYEIYLYFKKLPHVTSTNLTSQNIYNNGGVITYSIDQGLGLKEDHNSSIQMLDPYIVDILKFSLSQLNNSEFIKLINAKNISTITIKENLNSLLKNIEFIKGKTLIDMYGNLIFSQANYGTLFSFKKRRNSLPITISTFNEIPQTKKIKT
jgi:hypothetical protein